MERASIIAGRQAGKLHTLITETHEPLCGVVYHKPCGKAAAEGKGEIPAATLADGADATNDREV